MGVLTMFFGNKKPKKSDDKEKNRKLIKQLQTHTLICAAKFIEGKGCHFLELKEALVAQRLFEVADDIRRIAGSLAAKD
jgi:hypothetical protein